MGAISTSSGSSRLACSLKDAKDGKDVVVCCLEIGVPLYGWMSVDIRGSSVMTPRRSALEKWENNGIGARLGFPIETIGGWASYNTHLAHRGSEALVGQVRSVSEVHGDPKVSCAKGS
jgi:hypothetical protein